MLEWIQMEQWPPYAVGFGIGILSWFAFLLSDKHVSCSTALTRTSGMLEKLFRGKKVEEKDYYKEFPPKVEWDWMLLVGVLIGGFLSAWASGTLETSWVPALWSAAFGADLWPRLIVAVVGGVMMGFGARWADGCTSGHGISGTLQLAVSGWMSVVFFFIGGIVTAMLIFHVIAA